MPTYYRHSRIADLNERDAHFPTQSILLAVAGHVLHALVSVFLFAVDDIDSLDAAGGGFDEPGLLLGQMAAFRHETFSAIFRREHG